MRKRWQKLIELDSSTRPLDGMRAEAVSRITRSIIEAASR